MIDWNKTTTEESLLINKIAKRAAKELGYNVLNISMDIEDCHTNGCPLDLAGLLAANALDFAHDVSSIAFHIDRDTGKLSDNFVPRYAVRETANPLTPAPGPPRRIAAEE